MDTAFMRKTFALIAKGLIEKEQLLQTEPTRYPYSKAMQHGINMFLAASQWAGSQAAVEYPDETSFFSERSEFVADAFTFSGLALSVSSLCSLPPLPKGEALAKPHTLQFDRKLYRHAKGSPFGRAVTAGD